MGNANVDSLTKLLLFYKQRNFSNSIVKFQSNLVNDGFLSIGSEMGTGTRRQMSIQSFPEVLLSSHENVETKCNDTTKHYSLCGYVSPCLSIFARPVWYLVWYCFILFFQSMVVNGFINSSIASLEKRYKLSSKESSLIASMYDIGCMLVVLPVSFYGNKGHKPLWIGIGAVVMGLGCFIYASPQFFSGHYEISGASSKEIIMCNNVSSTAPVCNKTKFLSKLQNFKYLFYCGQFCIGMGGSPLFTLGVAYIEEINNKRESALHVGISSAITAIGPAVGYVTLGMLLKIYVDIKVPSPDITINETDIWVGAWWIGFLIAGFSFMILAIPLIMFPVMVNEFEDNVNNETRSSTVSVMDIFDVWKIIKSIVLNLRYVCVSLATTLTMLSLSGISTYGPKYFERIFGLTSSSSTITVGVVSVPTLATGALIGGILLSKYNWQLHGTLMFMAITTFVTVPLTLVFLLKCDETKMAGVNSLYNGTSKLTPTNLVAPCNNDCYCSQDQNNFHPSCGADNITYFSPCFAGCRNKLTKNDVTNFQNCTCIGAIKDGNQMTYKKCQSPLCSSFYIVLGILGVMLFFTYLRGAPSITATMRSVNQDEVTVALGCQSILSRIFGSIPGPILFGSIIDLTCILWGIKCGEFGNCLKYDINLFTKLFFTLMIFLNTLNAICFIIPRSLIYFNCIKDAN